MYITYVDLFSFTHFSYNNERTFSRTSFVVNSVGSILRSTDSLFSNFLILFFIRSSGTFISRSYWRSMTLLRDVSLWQNNSTLTSGYAYILLKLIKWSSCRWYLISWSITRDIHCSRYDAAIAQTIRNAILLYLVHIYLIMSFTQWGEETCIQKR